MSSISLSTMVSSSSSSLTLLPKDFVPTIKHVIIGRGKKHSKHPGNLRYGDLVQEEMQAYSQAGNKAGKSQVISNLVARVRTEGNFVREYTSEKGRWALVEEHAVRTTTAQHFRDALHSKYRSSKEMKKQKRKEDRRSTSGSSVSVAQNAAAAAAEDDHDEISSKRSRCVSPEDEEDDHFMMMQQRVAKRSRVASAPTATQEEDLFLQMPQLQTPVQQRTHIQMGQQMMQQQQGQQAPPMLNDCWNIFASAFVNNNQGGAGPSASAAHGNECNPFEPRPIMEAQVATAGVNSKLFGCNEQQQQQNFQTSASLMSVFGEQQNHHDLFHQHHQANTSLDALVDRYQQQQHQANSNLSAGVFDEFDPFASNHGTTTTGGHHGLDASSSSMFANAAFGFGAF